MNKATIAVLILVVGVFMAGCGTVSNQTVSDKTVIINGQLRVEGSALKDSSNQTIKLKGFCLTNGVYTSVTAPPTGYILAADDYNKIKLMGANVVRFYLQYSWLDAGNSDAFFTYMDAQLALLAAADLKAILSLHYFGINSSGSFYTGTQATKAQLQDFWKKISDRYVSNNVIAGYDLLNEPNCSDTFTETALYNIYESIITATIRNNNDQHVIFISDPVNKYDAPNASYFDLIGTNAFKKLSDTNVVYQFHWYKPVKFTHQTIYDNSYFQLGATYPLQENNETYTGGWYKNTAKISNTTGNWVTLTSDWLDVDNLIDASPTINQTDKLAIALLVGNTKGIISIKNVRVERTTNTANSGERVAVVNSQFTIPRRYNVHTKTPNNLPANWYLVSDVDGTNTATENTLGTTESGCLNFNSTEISWGAGSWATWKTSWWTGYQNYLDYTYGSHYKYRIIMDVNIAQSGSAEVYSAFEFYNIGTPTIQNKSFIETAITNYYVNWANTNGVPLYCGEWGVADPSQAISGYPNAPAQQVAWVNDMKDILYTKGIHWTYHDYKNYDNLGFGVFDANSRNEIKQALQNSF